MLICTPLKRFAAILLMGVLFFNWYGYQLLSNYWQNRAEHRLEASLDQNKFDPSALITFKVPLTSLAYYNSSSVFERVNGQIEIGGVRYQYVKRRIFGDSLEVVCIPNMTSMQLKNANNEFFRQVNDLQQQTQGKKNTHPVKNVTKDYRPATAGVEVPNAYCRVLEKTSSLYAATRLPSIFSPTAENPPEQL